MKQEVPLSCKDASNILSRKNGAEQNVCYMFISVIKIVNMGDDWKPSHPSLNSCLREMDSRRIATFSTLRSLFSTVIND